MSEKNLQSLIETIKSEAIIVAKQQADEIISEAKKEADSIIKIAENKRKFILDEAEKEVESSKINGNNALKQAARDIVITLENDIKKMFETILETEVKNSFSNDVVKNAILKIIAQVGSETEIHLPEKSISEIESYIQKQLQDTKKNIKIVPNNSLINGFEIHKKEEGWSYKITSKELTELLHSYLNVKWKTLLNK